MPNEKRYQMKVEAQ